MHPGKPEANRVIPAIYQTRSMSFWQHSGQSLSLDPINTHPALPFVREQTSRLKNLQVPGRGLACMRKYHRDLSGSHRASIEIDREQHAAPSRVGQRPEYILARISTRLRPQLRHQRYPGGGSA
jgi:hypothetical protein